MGDWYDMTAEQVLSFVNQKGIILTADGDQINYKAPTGVMTPDVAEMIRKHKPGILGILNPVRKSESIPPYARTSDNQDFLPDDCDACPAGGFWEFKGPGMLCFYSAYFLGKSAKQVECVTAKRDCPRKKTEILIKNKIITVNG